MLQIEKIREKVINLDEADAKSLLMIIYARLDTAINGNGGYKVVEETLKDLFDIYQKLPVKNR
ncbi:hypothetical protein [Desulforamulus ruminis]|uniref:Uncharacterized protein n=1 Tax=Desulforamulus ruminis (strain ATCC 23193 / DSM 2154 / NCIMB 8452 / DL) TaxID=696281 RepID=F6DSQ8_DESRL|nr:hypothetical protein [Desulforamulus ruminis]AEG58877.1 hypothetical protein Desru_0592 [Desulforamulus ruminis DSM 2154]